MSAEERLPRIRRHPPIKEGADLLPAIMRVLRTGRAYTSEDIATNLCVPVERVRATMWNLPPGSGIRRTRHTVGHGNFTIYELEKGDRL